MCVCVCVCVCACVRACVHTHSERLIIPLLEMFKDEQFTIITHLDNQLIKITHSPL